MQNFYKNNTKSLLLAGLLCLAVNAANSAETDSDEGETRHFSVNGFGTLGLTRSSSKEAGFVRDLSQPHGSQGEWSGNVDSLLGLQANWVLNERVAVIAQGISRYHQGSSYDPELMWGFVRYDPNGYSSFRLGRLATDFYMYADSRHVGYTYLTVRPSADYFGVLPFAHIDGVDAQWTLPLGDTLLRARVHGGWLNEKLPLGNRIWQLQGSRMLGGNISLQKGAWNFRLSSSQLKFSHNLPIDDLLSGLAQTGVASAVAAGHALEVADSTSRFDSLGAVYDEGPWQVQFMISRARHGSQAFQNWHSGYFLAGYRIGSLTPFAGYSWIRSKTRTLSTGLPDGVDPQLDLLNAGVAEVLADSHANQHTGTFGVRWDFQENMDLKIQFDAVRGKPGSTFPFRTETTRWNGKTNVLSVALDFVF